MNSKFSKALLLSGNDFRLTSSLTLYHPTVNDILSINSSSFPDYTYWIYVQTILSDPYTNMVMLDNLGKNYMDMTPYDVFILQWEHSEQAYAEQKDFCDSLKTNPVAEIRKALHFFIKGEHMFQKGSYPDGSVCFYDENDKNCQINREIYDYLYEWVKSINKIDDSDRIHPADENARQILIEDMRSKMKKAQKRKQKTDDTLQYLGNLMSAAAFGGNGSINTFNFKDCKIYWMNESLAVNQKKSNSEHLLDAIYHGTISAKDINKKELDWIS